MSSRYGESERMLERATRSIPLGSQTFSKSRASLPYGVSPLFVDRAKGCRFTDVDGNDYIDYVSGLLSISLGYCDKDVDQAVSEQLKSGVTFSLPHRLETECAEHLIELIPCAEQVRFGKNGTDVTSAAVRIARAYTGREHVAVCGYHGWQDWYISSTTRDLGVPKLTKSFTHTFNYNDIASLEALFEAHPKELAAVIMEPMVFDFPEDGFLEKVQSLCKSAGTILVFDEMITGFRFDLGGAQKLFGVTPDLATFGKGMANGFPLSALVGRRDIMDLMHTIFYSGTFAGETLSLAAGIATMNKMIASNTLEHIHDLGRLLSRKLNKSIETLGCEDFLSVKGHPSWSQLSISDYQGFDALTIKTFLLQSLFEKGLFALGTHNLNYAHGEEEIGRLVDAYDDIFPMIKRFCDEGSLSQYIKGEVLEPLFKVREN